MAGYTNIAFRELLRTFGGADLIATEMVSARSFVYMGNRNEEHPARLDGVREEQRPVSVQIWDNAPETLAKLANTLTNDYKVDVIDINFGCPARQIAQRSESGSALLRDPELVARIVRTVVQAASPTPVTAKIRLGTTRETINASEVANAVEEAGASGITVHGRTAAEMYRGKADWEEIAKVKPHLKRIPLIGNGDIKTAAEAVEKLKNYPVDGIMIGRGMLSNPYIFNQIKQFQENKTETQPDQKTILLTYYNLAKKHFGKNAIKTIKTFAPQLITTKPNSKSIRTKLSKINNEQEFLQIMEEWKE
jgi:tRNA-dihydrouridine synthase B